MSVRSPPTTTTITSTTTAQSRLVSAYVEAKVLSIRLATAQSIHLTTKRQLVLASGASSTPDAASSALALRLQRTGQVAMQLKSDLARRLTVIAELTGIDPGSIQATLASTLSMTVLPHFSVAVPARLPASIVRARRDVAAVESMLLRGDRPAAPAQYDMAQHAQAMQGWIEPRPSSSDAQASNASAPSSEQDNPAGPMAVVARSKQEVARNLEQLIAQSRAASTVYELTQLRRTEFQAARRRLELGEQPEFEVLERHILLLLETDRLAAALGDVAQCWIALNLSTAGQASVREDIVSTAVSPDAR